MGRGSTFTFTANFTINKNVRFNTIDLTKLTSIKKNKILFVDDNNVNRLFIGSVLEQIGCDNNGVASGLECIEQLKLAIVKDKPYDILILDYHMPNLSGLDVAKLLRKNNLDVKVLIISSSANYDEVMIEPNIHEFLSKPLKRKTMIDALYRLTCNNYHQSPIIKKRRKSIISKKKILIVEDNIVNRKVIDDILKQLGLATVDVENGLRALEELDKNPNIYSLILMDIHMPVMDGIEATMIIRNKRYKCAYYCANRRYFSKLG